MSRRHTSVSTHRRGRAALAAATGLACAAALMVGPAATAGSPDAPSGGLPRIKGSVGPGFEISINKSSVPAGRYKLIVKDEATIHNFHISGTGVDKATSLPFTGKKVFKITLVAGSYSIVCDAHPGTMNTTLSVT